MQVEAILFDKDGCLFDFQATWAGAMERFIDRAVDAPFYEAAARALHFDRALHRFAPESVAVAGTVQDIADAVVPFSSRSKRDLIALMDGLAADVLPVPVCDLVDCLGRLRGMCRLGVVTNDSEVPARAQLEAAGIGHFFDFISGFDSGNGVKPAPGPVRAGIAALRTVPERVLMVGDSLHDLHAAEAAGAIGVGVLTGVVPAEVLAPHAAVVLPHVGHIEDWLAAGR